MDYWNWYQDRLIAVRVWDEFFADLCQRAEFFPEMPQSLGLDIVEPPGAEA